MSPYIVWYLEDDATRTIRVWAENAAIALRVARTKLGAGITVTHAERVGDEEEGDEDCDHTDHLVGPDGRCPECGAAMEAGA